MLTKAAPQFNNMKEYILDEFAQRLTPIIYHKGQVIKNFEEEPIRFMIICGGSIGVYQRKMHRGEHGPAFDTAENDSTGYVLLNLYRAGTSLGDP